ncbi:MAG: type I-E CRISPR-associated protein Cas6/Cse3/CasE [Acidobacteriota bacterium]|nr:type I-E CRISPR-associated protein Cas6/Cse3/CasE [Acidobacteriota bacterium]
MRLFLSRLQFDLRRRHAQRLLLNSYAAHATVMRGFPNIPMMQPHMTPEQRAAAEQARRAARILFRVEPLPAGRIDLCILVQSGIAPDRSALVREVDVRHSTKELVLDFAQGDRFRFRLRANPTYAQRPEEAAAACTKRAEDGGQQRGKRLAVLSEARQFDWLKRLGEKRLGFTVAPAGVLVQDEGWTQFRKSAASAPIRFVTVLFEGWLTVTDAAAFSAAVSQGVGAAKGFGCGLLSLAPLVSPPRTRG